VARDIDFHSQGSSELGKGAGKQLEEGFDYASQGAFKEAFGSVSASDPVDEVLFAPTDFPNRPITNGAAFGPGANFVRTPKLSDRAILNRAATRILENKDDVPDDALVWAMRVLAGE